MSICKVAALDHLVLTVRSIPATVAFYARLGMAHETFPGPAGEQRHALRFGVQKLNLHVAGREFEPKATTALPGTADLCFIVHDDVDEVHARLAAAGIAVLEGGQVVPRTGARGPIRSVYVRDPDGNLVE